MNFLFYISFELDFWGTQFTELLLFQHVFLIDQFTVLKLLLLVSLCFSGDFQIIISWINGNNFINILINIFSSHLKFFYQFWKKLKSNCDNNLFVLFCFTGNVSSMRYMLVIHILLTILNNSPVIPVWQKLPKLFFNIHTPFALVNC